jgi:hypothetical protein
MWPQYDDCPKPISQDFQKAGRPCAGGASTLPFSTSTTMACNSSANENHHRIADKVVIVATSADMYQVPPSCSSTWFHGHLLGISI